jgi:DmsE family decaheme c-type cytochrome
LLGVASAIVLALLSNVPAVADDSDCLMCHENIGKAFEATMHGHLESFEVLGGETGCRTCHGDGAAHMDSGGEPGTILSLGDGMFRELVSDACVTCHRTGQLHDWQGSTHEMNGVGCSDCHSVHQPMDRLKHNSPEPCYACHREVQAQFQYPSHHPVREGHMTCAACHTPHGSSIGLIKHDERPAELCFNCHGDQSGPFLFEHEPVNEGCDTCHTPHGAVANNLLVQAEPFLCLQCHEAHFHSGLEAWDTDTRYVPRYDPDYDPGKPRTATYPGGEVPNPFGEESYRRAMTTKCSQCHTKVHGSDLPSQTSTGLGKGLMR